MACYDGSDSHFVVFFPVDKTVHIMAKNRVEFKNDAEGSVVVMWQTSDIEDDGKLVFKEMPYNGYVVFSGGKFMLFIYFYVKLIINTYGSISTVESNPPKRSKRK